MTKQLLPSEYFASHGGVSVRCLSVHESGEVFQTDHSIGTDHRPDSLNYAIQQAQQQHAAAVEVFIEVKRAAFSTKLDHGGVLCSVAFVSDIEQTALELTTNAMTNALRCVVSGVSSSVGVMQ